MVAESGVALPGTWDRVSARDLIAAGCLLINDGHRVKRSELGAKGIPFVRGGDIGQGWIDTDVRDHVLPQHSQGLEAKLSRPWDVAFITKGTVGRAGLLRPTQPTVVFSPQVCFWRSLDQNRLEPRFLFYVVRSPLFQQQLDSFKMAGAMVADYVSLRDQAFFEIPVPPVDEQRRISGVLGALDDKIELNRKMNRTLEEMAQAIFKSWFIDFDGVPQSEMVDSELGPIPKGWGVAPVGEAVTVVGGGTPRTKESSFWDGGTHCWTTPKDLSGATGPLLMRTARRITDKGLARISSGLLPRGTFLLSSRAPVGYTALTVMPVAVNQGYIAVPPGGRLSTYYLLHWARANLDAIKARAGGTTFQEISKRNFRPIPVVVPSLRRLADFDACVEPLFRRIEAAERESELLAELRDTLLPKLVSGEIRVGGSSEHRREHEPVG